MVNACLFVFRAGECLPVCIQDVERRGPTRRLTQKALPSLVQRGYVPRKYNALPASDAAVPRMASGGWAWAAHTVPVGGGQVLRGGQVGRYRVSGTLRDAYKMVTA